MTRKQALLAIFAMPLGLFTAYRSDAAERAKIGNLLIPLDQYRNGITVQFGSKTITFTAAEIFAALVNHDH